MEEIEAPSVPLEGKKMLTESAVVEIQEPFVASTYSGEAADYNVVTLNNSKIKFSPMHHESFDNERHIFLEEAFELIRNDSLLEIEKLEEAIRLGHITVYTFNEKKYLDRLDVGRVFHKRFVKKEGLQISLYFTNEGENPFDSVDYYTKDLIIKDFSSGKTIFELKGAEIPEWMDETSASIVAQKYFFKPLKKEWREKLHSVIGSEYEYSLKHLNKRVADFFTDEGWKLGYFKTEEDRENFRNELYFLEINGVGAFNSPTQFNSGLYNSYGVEGSPGINYWKDPETGEIKKVTNGEYIHPQLHACFIKGPNDNLSSIAKHVVDEIAIFSSGSGIGQDIGKLRGSNEKLSGGGKSSGPMSFFKIYDAVASAIKSGGKTRRAARMTTMRYNHPDVLEFIRSKVLEDKKALLLMQNGFSSGMDGDAYTTVAFQNTNLSVRLDDEFFESFELGREIQTFNVHDNLPNKKISAEQMLKEIAFGSWRIGDPAVQYETKIQKMHTCKNSGRQNSTNPCSEYLFLDDTSCSLYSLRNTFFMDENGNFKIEDYRHALKIFTIAQNIANEAASYPVKEIAQISTEFLTIGAGYADLGSLLMRKGLPYDSEEGRALAAAITALLTGTVYEVSAEIAQAMGPFTHYEFNRKPMLEVMEEHKKSLDKINWDEVRDSNLQEAAYSVWRSALSKGGEFGFKNAQATVLAPTGTISYLMGCSTTGVEPAMSLSIVKNLAGGGNIVIANKDVEVALRGLNYSEEQIKDITRYIGKCNTVINAPHMEANHYPIFDTAFGNAQGQGSINFEGHVRMVGAAQPFISGAISKTNNLPKSASVKQIYDAYLLGHELGLKAISIFRNESKPISAVDFGRTSGKVHVRGEKEDLPSTRKAYEWEVRIGNTPFHIVVSEYDDGRPGQIAFLSYNAGSTLNSLFTISGVSASKALKRGLHLKDATEGWLGQQFEPKGLVFGHPYIKTASSPLDFAARLLKLEYLGEKDMAEPGVPVDVKKLRGFSNGSFNTYRRLDFDEWDINDVLNDPETGGFKNGSFSFPKQSKDGSVSNSRAKVCSGCGNIMLQTGPNCFECKNCGDKVGGCGA